MKVVMIYFQYLDRLGIDIKIGGVETYLTNLSEVVKSLNCEPIIVQSADKYFERDINGIKVYGIPNKNKKNMQKLIKHAEEIADIKNDILIFGSSTYCRKSRFKKVISIQHGIYWDVDTVHGLKNISSETSTILRCIQTLIEIKRQRSSNLVVCVDNNYINWFRSQTIDRRQKQIMIPNCAFSNGKEIVRNNNELVRVIYARRFEKIRGTEIILEAMPEILDKYNNISFTLAGDGSYCEILKSKFEKYKNVDFITYEAKDSIEIHSNYDIAIIPSIASEGTSLSLLEAMYSKCAVIATNVGGMTNIIINEFNGLLVAPNPSDISNAVERLINNKELREELSKNAKKVVDYSFSEEKWKIEWRKVIELFL